MEKDNEQFLSEDEPSAQAGRVIVSSSLRIHQGQQKCLQTSNLAGRVLTINSNQTEGWWGREREKLEGEAGRRRQGLGGRK